MKDKNVVVWIVMILGYGVYGYGKEVLELYYLMEGLGIVFNEIIFLIFLLVCGYIGMVDEGK